MACPRPVKTRQAAKQQRTAKVTASRCPSFCSGLAGSGSLGLPSSQPVPAKNRRRGRGGIGGKRHRVRASWGTVGAVKWALMDSGPALTGRDERFHWLKCLWVWTCIDWPTSGTRWNFTHETRHNHQSPPIILCTLYLLPFQ